MPNAKQATVQAKVPAAVKIAYIGQNEAGNSTANLDLVMGIQAASEDNIEAIHTHHDHHHTHDHAHEHAHDHFDSFVIRLGEVNTQTLQGVLQQLLNDNAIYRCKGFAALPDKPMRQVLQAVGKRLETHFDRLWQADEERCTSLVFIGKHLDEQQITTALQQAQV